MDVNLPQRRVYQRANLL